MVFYHRNDLHKGEWSERRELSGLAGEDLAMMQQIVQQSQSPWSFESQIIHFKHIQLDEYPMIKMQSDSSL